MDFNSSKRLHIFTFKKSVYLLFNRTLIGLILNIPKSSDRCAQNDNLRMKRNILE